MRAHEPVDHVQVVAILLHDDVAGALPVEQPVERPVKSLPNTARMQVPVPIANKKNEKGNANGKDEVPRGQVPVDVRKPEYNGKDDDAIMQDETLHSAQQRKKVVGNGKNDVGPDNNEERRVTGVRQSEIAAHGR